MDKCSKQAVDVIFATNDEFCKYAAVAISSLLDNNRDLDIKIHLFTIECNELNIKKITDIVGLFNQQIKIYVITNDLFKNFPPTGNYSIACYLRLLTPSLLPKSDKALYLDCDIVVRGSIRDLWNIDISDCALAGVPDAILSYNIVKNYLDYDYFEGYINSGVLLMNLQYWRKYQVEQQLLDYLGSHVFLKLPDQDAINIVLHNSIKIIHPKWNCHVGYFAFPPLVVKEQKIYIKDLWKKAQIIHFTGPAKPWCVECVNPYKYVWESYSAKYLQMPLVQLEKSIWKSKRIIFFREVKNVIARLFSVFYI